VLGLKVATESPGFVLLGDDQPDVPALGLGTHSEVRGRNADPARHRVGFASDDLRADWKRLKEARVEFVEDPTDYGDTPAGLPKSRLAILPGTSHVTLVHRVDLLLAIIPAFLDTPMPQGK